MKRILLAVMLLSCSAALATPQWHPTATYGPAGMEPGYRQLFGVYTATYESGPHARVIAIDDYAPDEYHWNHLSGQVQVPDASFAVAGSQWGAIHQGGFGWGAGTVFQVECVQSFRWWSWPYGWQNFSRYETTGIVRFDGRGYPTLPASGGLTAWGWFVPQCQVGQKYEIDLWSQRPDPANYYHDTGIPTEGN